MSVIKVKKNPGNNISMVIPGLYESIQFREQTSLQNTGLPLLQLILSKSSATTIDADTVEDTLLSLFINESHDLKKPSLARISACADLGFTSEAHWLRVDPVHLVADKDSLLMQSPEILQITREEADKLISMLNELYRDKGWEFLAPHPNRWYLKMSETHKGKFSSVSRAKGRNIREVLPTGEDGAKWNAVLSEIQMMLHSADVNQLRNQLGKPAINSVWIWGEGDDEVKLVSPWDCVMADDPLTQGLCLLAGTRHLYPLNDFLTRLPVFRGSTIQVCKGEILIVLENIVDKCNEMPSQDCLRELQDQYLRPIFNMVKRGRIQSLSLYPCNGTTYLFRRSSLWKFWKPNRALRYFLQQ